ncbi:hypothetical protein SAMN06295973_1702 [Plantibacter cousiniae]|uniref:Uncharacterized protein n=1 Tax=Plantibacter cousiniae (nom. nud.) TaxID=199709 RepID=A0ABY1LM45_9MICO|nr:hypothetical protein SAMN06295973_1702 [Plantibacter cousiniae]
MWDRTCTLGRGARPSPPALGARDQAREGREPGESADHPEEAQRGVAERADDGQGADSERCHAEPDAPASPGFRRWAAAGQVGGSRARPASNAQRRSAVLGSVDGAPEPVDPRTGTDLGAAVVDVRVAGRGIRRVGRHGCGEIHVEPDGTVRHEGVVADEPQRPSAPSRRATERRRADGDGAVGRFAHGSMVAHRVTVVQHPGASDVSAASGVLLRRYAR